MLATIIFVALLSLAAYPYVGYPVLLYLLTKGRAEPVPPGRPATPSVTIIISAYNEGEVIGDTVCSLQEVAYPWELLRVAIGSDGSTDDTAAVARSAARPGFPIEVLEFDRRRGKAGVLRELLDRATSEIVVLCDANTHFEVDAVANLVRWFGDSKVGCVCGRLELVPLNKTGRTERRYWRFETWLKQRENRVGAVLGANGGIYALRLAAYRPLEEDVITDDFVLPMAVRMRGYRIVYDPAAVATEDCAPTIAHEYSRRKRIGAGNVQALRLTRQLLRPGAGWTAFAYWSHKVARWVAPIFMAAAALVAVTQVRRPLYSVAVGVVLVVLLLAAAGWVSERLGREPGSVFASPYAFVAMNLALVLGAARFVAGHRDARWQRTPRNAPRPSSGSP